MRIPAVLPVVLWIIAVFITCLGATKITNNSDNLLDHDVAHLPYDVYLPYKQVEHVYGLGAALYFRYRYEDWPDKARELISKDELARDQINNAMQNKFWIPPDLERDLRIRNSYTKVIENYSNIERRLNPSERWKDFFAYFGVAAMVGFAALACSSLRRQSLQS